MITEIDTFKRNLHELEKYDREYLKTSIFTEFREYIAKNGIIFFYIDTLPTHLKELSCSVLKINDYRVILLVESELDAISKKLKIPIVFVRNIAIIHELSHIMADMIGAFNNESVVWKLGEMLILSHNIPEYFYHRIKNYLQR